MLVYIPSSATGSEPYRIYFGAFDVPPKNGEMVSVSCSWNKIEVHIPPKAVSQLQCYDVLRALTGIGRIKQYESGDALHGFVVEALKFRDYVALDSCMLNLQLNEALEEVKRIQEEIANESSVG